jgi:alkanesulfonate monooxygenase SsuD/methylene tetrahydromethanopterin reductase-like flavin-dependent oxidoreductase (luciferase family)
MRFAVQLLLGQHGASSKQIYRQAITIAEVAEECGFETMWLAEHHFTEYGTLPSIPVLGAAIAEHTSTIRIGSAVVVLPFHDPRHVAEDYAMLDVLSDGRLELGVGRGYQPLEFEAFSVDMAESRTRFEESLEIIELLWTGEPVSYHGHHYSFDNVQLRPQPIQQPAPIWVAAVSPPTIEWAAKQGRRILTGPQITPLPIIKEANDRYMQLLAEAGHDTAAVVLPQARNIYCAPDAQAAYDDPMESVLWFKNLNAERIASATASRPADGSYDFYQRAQKRLRGSGYDDLLSTGSVLSKTPDEMILAIKDIEQATGLNYLICNTEFAAMSTEKVTASLRRFAAEVMPAFTDQ